MADNSFTKRHQRLLVLLVLMITNIICVITYMWTYQTKHWLFNSVSKSYQRYATNYYASHHHHHNHHHHNSPLSLDSLQLCARYLWNQSTPMEIISTLTSTSTMYVLFSSPININHILQQSSINNNNNNLPTNNNHHHHHKNHSNNKNSSSSSPSSLSSTDATTAAALHCVDLFQLHLLQSNIELQKEISNNNIDNNCFVPQITTKHLQEIHESLKLLQKSFFNENIELILDSGSLIGSWRHHNPIPYDDDFDFRIWSKDKLRARALLEWMTSNASLHWVFEDTEAINQHWKLGIVCQFGSQSISKCAWQVDIFFNWFCYSSIGSSSGVGGVSGGGGGGRIASGIDGNTMCFLEPPTKYSLDIVYPLVYRPFAGLLFQTYYNYSAYFYATYKTKENICKYYTHSNNAIACATPEIPCDWIQHRFPFTIHAPVNKKDASPPMELLLEMNATSSINIKSMLIHFSL